MIERSPKTKARRRRHRASGVSLLEMTIVVALTIVVAVIAVLKLPAMLSAQHLTNAYNITLSAMRQARDNAVSQRTSYSATFASASTGTTITVAPTLTFSGSQASVIYRLPTDVAFAAVTGVGSVTPTPDNYGTAANGIDFGYTSNGNAGGTTAYTIYFCPDGSAQTDSTCAGGGNWDGGVVYLNGPVTWSGSVASGTITNSRAISMWGATGRLHGWRLYSQGAGYIWMRQ